MNHDIAHCNGIMMSEESICNQCASCRRYQAHIEAVKLQLEYVCYIEIPKGATPLYCPEYWSMKGGGNV